MALLLEHCNEGVQTIEEVYRWALAVSIPSSRDETCEHGHKVEVAAGSAVRKPFCSVCARAAANLGYFACFKCSTPYVRCLSCSAIWKALQSEAFSGGEERTLRNYARFLIVKKRQLEEGCSMFDRALQAWKTQGRRGVRGGPDAWTLHMYAECLLQSDRAVTHLDKIIQLLEMTVQTQGSPAASKFLLARALLLKNEQLGDGVVDGETKALEQRAFSLLTVFLEHSPRHIQGNYLRASLLSSRDSSAASVAFQRTLALDPVHVPTLVGLAMLLQRQGETLPGGHRWRAFLFEQAQSYYLKAMAIAPSCMPLLINYSVLLSHHLNRPAKGRRLLEEALKHAPEDPSILCNIASLHEQAGDLVKAEEVLIRAIEMSNGRHVGALYNMGRVCHYGRNNTGLAIKFYEEVCDLTEDSKPHAESLDMKLRRQAQEQIRMIRNSNQRAQQKMLEARGLA